MGKYMKKAKALGAEVALMEVPHPSSLGVRTRARTRAFQRLQNPSPAPASASSSLSYLQLRSRRLYKVPPASPKPKDCPNPSPSPKSRGKGGSCLRPEEVASESASIRNCGVSNKVAVQSEASPVSDAGVEVSLGENVLDCEGRSRNARETTPCSLIRNSEVIKTPGSTTRRTSSPTTRTQNLARRYIPTTQEMEELFSGAEQTQQQNFVEKYNYDPVKDRPLPGRYEWVKVNQQSPDDCYPVISII